MNNKGMNNKEMTSEDMSNKNQEMLQQKKTHEQFNAVTQKVKVENQNQTHNSRKEGIAPINQKR